MNPPRFPRSRDPQLERSAALRREADVVMQEIGLLDALRLAGVRVALQGSYFLDTMIYPDIDIYVSKMSVEELFLVAGRLAAHEKIAEIVFQRSRVPNLPGGLYLKLRCTYGDWGRPWKIDIWSLDDALITESLAEMQCLKDAMTEQIREQIIRYKASILTSEGRTPMYSGYYIYKAFIEEGLSDHRQVTQYLIDHGIVVAPDS